MIDLLFAQAQELGNLGNQMIVDDDGVQWTIDTLEENGQNKIASLRAEIPAASPRGDVSYVELMCGYLDGVPFYNLTDFDAQQRLTTRKFGQEAGRLGHAFLDRLLLTPQKQYVDRPQTRLAK